MERIHRSNLGRFVGILLFVFSGRGGTEARFDDLVVPELPAG
jgi:hypothetical protein